MPQGSDLYTRTRRNFDADQGPMATDMMAPFRSHLPLQGRTLLLVEDSRFASDALRLMAQRSGARFRRAATIAAAQGHLRVYRPDLVLVDLGLPDGRGEDLIRDIAQSRLCPVLAISGDAAGRAAALAAGAAAFVEKPFPSLARFQRVILEALGLPEVDSTAQEAPAPDRMALIDDLRQAAIWLASDEVRAAPRFLVGFVAGVARQSGDAGLLAAARTAASDAAGLDGLQQLVDDRLARPWPQASGTLLG